MYKINIVQDNSSEAAKNYETAVDLGDKKNPDVYVTLSEAYTSQNYPKKIDKAIELLKLAVATPKKNTNAFISLGRVYLGNSNGTDAIKNFEEALNIDPKNSEALTLKARVYVLITNYNDAITLLNEAISNDNSYSPAYYELSELYATLKDYSKAAENYSKYIETSEITPEKRKRFASILYLNKEYNKTINILKDLITTEKDITGSIRILAYSYYKLDDVENSMTYFQKLLAVDSVDFLSTDYENYADLLSKTGNDSLSIEYMYKVVDLDSTRKDMLSKISILHFKNKNWTGVINALERKNQITAQEYFDLGKAYYFTSENFLSQLTQDLATTLNLTPENKSQLRNFIIQYQKDLNEKSNKDSVVSNFTHQIESLLAASQKSSWNSVKERWLTSVNNSNVYLDYLEADSALSILSVKAPELAIAYFWRARVNTNFDPESNLGLAKPYYEQFITLASKDVEKYKKELIEAYSYFGYYYYLQEDNPKSKSYWEQVLVLDPENKQAIEVLKHLK
jgi:tetratricopeptide (TPR) repeat protein